MDLVDLTKTLVSQLKLYKFIQIIFVRQIVTPREKPFDIRQFILNQPLQHLLHAYLTGVVQAVVSLDDLRGVDVSPVLSVEVAPRKVEIRLLLFLFVILECIAPVFAFEQFSSECRLFVRNVCHPFLGHGGCTWIKFVVECWHMGQVFEESQDSHSIADLGFQFVVLIL